MVDRDEVLTEGRRRILLQTDGRKGPQSWNARGAGILEPRRRNGRWVHERLVAVNALARKLIGGRQKQGRDFDVMTSCLGMLRPINAHDLVILL